MRLYLDANAIIYSVESSSVLREAVKQHVTQVRASRDGIVVTSALSRLECRTGPMRRSDLTTLGQFDALFADPELLVFDIDTAVVDRATELRARQAFRTPDAIHLATALLLDCDTFLTGDERLKRCEGINVAVLSVR
jgi:predicted nucleic acid-binding protein